MINFKINNKQFSKTMWNTMQYANGFFEGVESSRLLFNVQLGKITEEVLKKYIDSRARMSPDSLHHVYEWGSVGNPSARLFEIDSDASAVSILFSGRFLPSRSVSENSEEPFVDKANVMENRIQIVVEPRDAEALVFEANGEAVFTVNSIYVDNPGGDAVAGSFGRVIDEFFQNYFTVSFLAKNGILEKLRRPQEFADNFAAGAKSGSFVGKMAGAKYMNISGVVS